MATRKEYNLAPPGGVGPAPGPPRMQDKKDVRTAEVLDRDVRKYRKQLEIQTGKEGNEKAIKATQSSLALAEKRLKELTLSKLDSSNEETPNSPHLF